MNMITLKKRTSASGRYEILNGDVAIGEVWRNQMRGTKSGFGVSLTGIYWRSGGVPTRRGGSSAQRVKLLRDVVPFVVATLEKIASEPPRQLSPAEITNACLARAEAILREEHRVTLGTDFSYTVKYNEVHILCHYVYSQLIEEVFAQVGQPIASLHTYGKPPVVAHDEKEMP